MKKLSLILLFSIMIGGVAFAQSAPEMDFKKTEHNFGSIKEEIGAVTTQFEFTNDGSSPLIIQRVSASCGCTTPSYTREPILPGKKGKIDVKYSTVRRPGTFNKTITVYTNVPDTVYVLTIKGNVVPKQ
jgi:Protein of unknown function (DUF1573).